jgi:hypothetical protein
MLITVETCAASNQNLYQPMHLHPICNGCPSVLSHLGVPRSPANYAPPFAQQNSHCNYASRYHTWTIELINAVYTGNSSTTSSKGENKGFLNSSKDDQYVIHTHTNYPHSIPMSKPSTTTIHQKQRDMGLIDCENNTMSIKYLHVLLVE